MQGLAQIRAASLTRIEVPKPLPEPEFSAWTVQGIGRGDKVLYQPFHTERGTLGPLYATYSQATAAVITRRATGQWERNLAFLPLEPAPAFLADGKTPNPGATEGPEHIEN